MMMKPLAQETCDGRIWLFVSVIDEPSSSEYPRLRDSRCGACEVGAFFDDREVAKARQDFDIALTNDSNNQL